MVLTLKIPSSKIEDENIALTSFLPSETETVDNNSCEGGKIMAKLPEAGTSERGVEVVETLIKGVDLNGGLDSGGKGRLDTLASGMETTESMKVRKASLRKGRL